MTPPATGRNAAIKVVTRAGKDTSHHLTAGRELRVQSLAPAPSGQQGSRLTMTKLSLSARRTFDFVPTSRLAHQFSSKRRRTRATERATDCIQVTKLDGTSEMSRSSAQERHPKQVRNRVAGSDATPPWDVARGEAKCLQ